MREKSTGQRPPAREIQGLPLPLQLFLEGICALIQSILFKIRVPWSLPTLLEISESVLEGGGICKRFLVCRVFFFAVWGWDMMLLKARKQHKTKETVLRVEIAVLHLNGWSHLTVCFLFYFSHCIYSLVLASLGSMSLLELETRRKQGISTTQPRH